MSNPDHNNQAGLQALADSAPQPAEKKQPAPATRRGSSPALGKLDLAAYLRYHGLEFNIKEAEFQTLFRLNNCLFDAGHGKNEAAIGQDRSGLLTYHCFHQSCAEKTWPQARQIISGDKNLAEWCEGYDPAWQPPARASKPSQAPPGPPGPPEENGPVQAPDSTNKDFIYYSKRGLPGINPAKLANFLEDQFKPLFYEGTDYGKAFYKYHKAGVWKFYSDSAIRRVARYELGDLAKPTSIRDSLQLLQDQTYLDPEHINPDPMILNLVNGMYSLGTGEIAPHAASYYSRVQMPVRHVRDYHPRVIRLWFRTLQEVFADDADKIDVLQRFFGYCLYPRIIFPAALFQIGPGGNGKGLIESVLCAMLGDSNVSHISLKRMEKDFGPIEIKDKLLNSCGETEAGQMDVTNFKAIAAGDQIQAEVKFKNDVKFTPFAKHMISMNAFPGIKDKTNAFFRRIIVLEYKQVFSGSSADPYLRDKLLEEIDGIFMWALEGLKDCLKHGEIIVPESVEGAKRRFKEKSSPVLLYVQENCLLGENFRVLPPDLYKDYGDWCDHSGVRQPLGKHNFYEQIRLNFTDVVKRRPSYETKEYFVGITIESKQLTL